MFKKTRYLLLFLLFVQLPSWYAREADKPDESLSYGIPSHTDLLLSCKGFSIGYSHVRRQPLWVCYILTAEKLQLPRVRRRNKFMPDPRILRDPVKPADYRRTGFDRGHLAPAADMSYSSLMMKHSFYMSNISPQLPGCNRGIWKRLEMQVRKWAIREKQICIITGPLFTGESKNMGKSRIAVPDGFYKIILDLTPPYKMAAFIIPNQATRKRLTSFAVPADKVEEITGFDFFPNFPGAEELEKATRSELWFQ